MLLLGCSWKGVVVVNGAVSAVETITATHYQNNVKMLQLVQALCYSSHAPRAKLVGKRRVARPSCDRLGCLPRRVGLCKPSPCLEQRDDNLDVAKLGGAVEWCVAIEWVLDADLRFGEGQRFSVDLVVQVYGGVGVGVVCCGMVCVIIERIMDARTSSSGKREGSALNLWFRFTVVWTAVEWSVEEWSGVEWCVVSCHGPA